MQEIRTDLERWQRAGESIALATLVRVERAAPRKPGARMLVTARGQIAGSVSGGCVESDVAAHAAEVLADGTPRIAHYGIPDALGLTVGLSCGGALDVLIEPFAPDDTWTALGGALDERRPAALCVALAPARLLGRRLVVLDGPTKHAHAPGAAARTADNGRAEDAASIRTTGRAPRTPATAGGDAGRASACQPRVAGAIDSTLDAAIVRAARAQLADGGTREMTLPHANGDATIFIETFPPQAQLIIVGATEVGMHLARMAVGLGFRVSVIDPRGVYATPERFPQAEIVRAWPDEALAATPLDPWSYLVTLTHDAKFDVPTLAAALRSPARYVGAMGSRRTHAGRVEQLRAEGFSERDLARVHAPIGLAIGARTPAEIAVAILAELVAVRAGAEARVGRTPNHAVPPDADTSAA